MNKNLKRKKVGVPIILFFGERIQRKEGNFYRGIILFDFHPQRNSFFTELLFFGGSKIKSSKRNLFVIIFL